MVKIQFTNAKVTDDGFGLSVNGKTLDKIISTALGTRVGDNYGYTSGLPNFKSTCCNVTVIIDPQPVGEHIEIGGYYWDSVEDLEEDKREQFSKKTETAES